MTGKSTLMRALDSRNIHKMHVIISLESNFYKSRTSHYFPLLAHHFSQRDYYRIRKYSHIIQIHLSLLHPQTELVLEHITNTPYTSTNIQRVEVRISCVQRFFSASAFLCSEQQREGSEIKVLLHESAIKFSHLGADCLPACVGLVEDAKEQREDKNSASGLLRAFRHPNEIPCSKAYR